MGNQRECGVLLPISSLPSKYGIGCFSKSAYEFVDQLKAAGQGCWQILPLGPTSYGDSPYQSFSTFAGNPYFISLEDLIEEGVLTEKECDAVDFGSREDDVDYEKIYKGRYKLLRKAYERSDISKNPDFVRFQQEQAHWLGDYALFMAVKDRFEGIPWTEWAEDIRLRWNNALDYYRKELYFEIEFQEYMQFKFYEQWAKLKAYANRRGIRIIGDIPIYVAMDSADTWANPGLFKLDENNEPTQVAGCPPDGFSATGQLWGNPLYRWDVHKNTGFEWWIKRLAHCFNMYDVVRIDHFRGFDEYYSIPYGDPTAEFGHWEKGPGLDLFARLKKSLKKEELPGQASVYIEVLDRQSRRLKKLTEDLVEASKASTGNMHCSLACTDIVELVQQAVGEYEEKLAASQLEAVINDREAKCLSAKDRGKVPVVDEQPAPSTSQVIQPIIAAGDAIGSVILMGKTDKDIPGASEKLLAQTAAGFLGRQMEQ